VKCPQCGTENPAGAEFCSECAEPLAAPVKALEPEPKAEPDAAAQPASRKANLTGLLVLIIIILAVALIFVQFKPKSGTSGMAGMDGMTNPHAEGGMDMANPHAEGDTGSVKEGTANPHGEGATGSMEQLKARIDDARGKLTKDPLDVAALQTLYEIYSMVGMQSKLTPYFESALAELGKRKFASSEEMRMTASKLSSAATMAGDAEGAIKAIKVYQQKYPEDISANLMIANTYYDLKKPADAIKWYDTYLAKATPEKGGEDYWYARVDRAAMYLEQPKDAKLTDPVGMAVAELEAVTAAKPDIWNGWFNLGVAYAKAGSKDKAREVFKRAQKDAPDKFAKWRVDTEIAKLEGREPPAPPSNPHGEADVGGMTTM